VLDYSSKPPQSAACYLSVLDKYGIPEGIGDSKSGCPKMIHSDCKAHRVATSCRQDKLLINELHDPSIRSLQAGGVTDNPGPSRCQSCWEPPSQNRPASPGISSGRP